MKVKDIAKQFNVDKDALEIFIKKSGYKFRESSWSWEILVDSSEDVDAIIRAFNIDQCNKKAEIVRRELEKQAEKEAAEKAELEKKRALASMLITSGFNFDGYTIKKYSGYISGDDAIQIPRGTASIFDTATNVGEELMKSLVVIRRNALAELKEAAYALGCNAVIGVDFDYLTLDPETANFGGGTTYLPYVFGVTANGNAVVIEKNEE